MEYLYSPQLKGKVYQGSDNSFTYTLLDSGNFGGVAASTSFSTVRNTCTLTGYYVERTAGKMCLSDKGYWIFLPEWTPTGEVGVVSNHTDVDAKKLINEIISNNIRILQNNLICARFSHYLTNQEKKNLCSLQYNLSNRNLKLKNSNFFTNITTNYPKGLSDYAPYLEKIEEDYYAGKLGVAVSTIVMIVTAVAAIAGIGTIIYYNYIAIYNESGLDVEYSEKLLAKLKEKLTEEEFQQLEKETKGMITKAYFKGTGSGVTGLVKWSLIAVGGFFIYKTVKNYINENN